MALILSIKESCSVSLKFRTHKETKTTLCEDRDQILVVRREIWISLDQSPFVSASPFPSPASGDMLCFCLRYMTLQSWHAIGDNMSRVTCTFPHRLNIISFSCGLFQSEVFSESPLKVFWYFMQGNKFLNDSYVSVISGCTGIQTLYDRGQVSKDCCVKQCCEENKNWSLFEYREFVYAWVAVLSFRLSSEAKESVKLMANENWGEKAHS